MADTHTAFLSSAGGFTSFSFGNCNIRFRTANSLQMYTRVVSWDKGYLVVMAKYLHNDFEEEEYIDLVPILENLYFDAEKFLNPIEEVTIKYDKQCT